MCFINQELKEDNRVLVETKDVLEDQLESWRARTDKIHQLEKHILLLKAQVQDMEQVRRRARLSRGGGGGRARRQVCMWKKNLYHRWISDCMKNKNLQGRWLPELIVHH